LVDEISNRLNDMGIQKLYLPHLTTEPPKEQCLPIYVTKPEELKHKDRVVVLIPDGTQELEMLNFQVMMNEEDLESASLLGFANGLQKEGLEAPGLVVLNTSQLLYSHKLGRAVSLHNWNSQKRKSMIHPPQVILDQYNKIPGHFTVEEHISSVFEQVLKNESFVKKTARLDVIAIRQGGAEVLAYLNQNCESTLSPRMILTLYSREVLQTALLACFAALLLSWWNCAEHGSQLAPVLGKTSPQLDFVRGRSEQGNC
jgi:hypothetical protein